MFDALLRAGGLRAAEVEDLRFFGVTGALVPSDDSAVPCTADGVRRGWDEVVAAARRLRRGGIAAWAALGVHPGRIPPRGLEALLAELPDALGRPEVAALGLVGLAAGGEHEERVLTAASSDDQDSQRQRVCGKPRSTLEVAGSGQRSVTTLVRV